MDQSPDNQHEDGCFRKSYNDFEFQSDFDHNKKAGVQMHNVSQIIDIRPGAVVGGIAFVRILDNYPFATFLGIGFLLVDIGLT